MVERGIIPACANDLARYKDNAKMMAGERPELYKKIVAETEKLKTLCGKVPDNLEQQANYFCETVKPQMSVLRAVVDQAEGLMEKGLYPYPTYEKLLYSHHF